MCAFRSIYVLYKYICIYTPQYCDYFGYSKYLYLRLVLFSLRTYLSQLYTFALLHAWVFLCWDIALSYQPCGSRGSFLFVLQFNYSGLGGELFCISFERRVSCFSHSFPYTSLHNLCIRFFFLSWGLNFLRGAGFMVFLVRWHRLVSIMNEFVSFFLSWGLPVYFVFILGVN